MFFDSAMNRKNAQAILLQTKNFTLRPKKRFRQNFQLSFCFGSLRNLSLYARATVFNFIKIKRYFISIVNFVKLFHKLYLISAASRFLLQMIYFAPKILAATSRWKWLLEVVAASCFAVSVLFLLQVSYFAASVLLQVVELQLVKLQLALLQMYD